MNHRTMTIVGGVSFIAGALAFVSVFTYLAANFDYPDILDGAAADVLPRLQGGGSAMRSVWAIYAFLPLFLIPGAVGACFSCPSSRARMSLAVIFGCMAAFAMCLGLMRWPTIHWALADAYRLAGDETRLGLDAIFDGLNLYLGNYIGEFFGESALALFFLLTGLSMLEETRFPRWLGQCGIGFSVMFFAGAFRNVASEVQIIADVNNGLLPLWMIVLGSALIRYSKVPD
jgi:hypothetical protein